MNKEVAKIRD